MTTRFHAAPSFVLALAALLVGCTPDVATSPNSRLEPRTAAKDVNLTTFASYPALYAQLRRPSEEVEQAQSISAVTQIADDFVVAQDADWTVYQFGITGRGATNPITFSIRVDDNGHPGAVVPNTSLTLTAVAAHDNFATTDYIYTLPTPVVLTPGRYWFAVVVRSGAGALLWAFTTGRPLLPSVATVNGSDWGELSNDHSLGIFGTFRPRQVITLTSTAPAPAYVNGSYTMTAQGGLSSNPVVVSVAPASVCTSSGSTVAFVGVGACTITANQAGDDTYDAASPVTQTVSVAYHFDGFLGGVRSGDVLNTAKAGQTVALRWRLTDANGAPIASLAIPHLTVDDLNCALGTTTDQAVEQAAGNSGLQNLGDGFYQFNWKTPASYAKSCKTLKLDLGEGTGARIAGFAFTK